MVERDFTRLTTEELINGIKAIKLPDYLRSKYHGEDVRESIAQLAEMTIQLGVNLGLSPNDALLWARKLQESISQSEFDSWVATLLDGGPSIFMNTLSELQTTYPNGAAGVALVRETDPAKIYVWNGSVWEDFGDYQGIEIKDGTVTTSKRTALGEFSMLQITSDPPNFDFVNEQLVIPASTFGYHEVVHRNNVYPLPEGELVINLAIPGYARGFITFNIKTSSFNIYNTSTRSTISEDEVMLGVYNVSTKRAYLNGPYLINGRIPSAPSGVKMDMINDIPHMWKHCTILLGGENLPIVDNYAKVLRFPPNVHDSIIYVGGTAYINSPSSSGLTIDLSTINTDYVEGGSTGWCVLFNTSNKEFVLSKWSDVSKLSPDHAIFATIRVVDGKYHFNMPCPFLIDGKLYGVSDSTNIVENTLDATVKAVAHRGYSRDAPENTLPAYKLAKEKGYSYVEVDIEWTSDNVPVCLHDSTIDRTSNGTGNIRDLTLGQVKSYDFGSWKSSRYAGTEIPTLEEFLLLCKKLNLHPYLESKGGMTNEQAEILVNTVKKVGMNNRVTWICFSSSVLSSLLNFDDKARVGFLGSLSETLINTALSLKNGSNEVFVDVSAGSITKELAEMALLNDVDLEAWTVNSASSVEGLITNGVTGITTDVLNIVEIMQGLT